MAGVPPARAHQPRWGRDDTWSISANHLEATEAALLCEFGAYRVRWESVTLKFCTVQCRNGNPDRARECKCACLGEGHGLGGEVGDKVVDGKLLIDLRRSVREWTVAA